MNEQIQSLHKFRVKLLLGSNVLVTGKMEEEHLAALEEVLWRMKEAGFQLKREKCVFLATLVVYSDTESMNTDRTLWQKSCKHCKRHPGVRAQVLFRLVDLLCQVSSKPLNRTGSTV